MQPLPSQRSTTISVSLTVLSSQLRLIAAEVGRVKKTKIEWGACAIIASSDAMFGMTRMFQVFAEEHFADSCVFREREEAERWIAALRTSGD